MSETIEAYKIGVSFVADATRINGPIGEMLRNMDKIAQAQKSVNMGFVEMVSSLGGARRLAAGIANDLERAARAARDMASASGRFRGGFGSGGGGNGGGDSGSSSPRPRSSGPAGLPMLLPSPGSGSGGGGIIVPPGGDVDMAFDPIPVGPIHLGGGSRIGAGIGAAARAIGPYAAMGGAYLGGRGVHSAFQQGENVGDTAAMMANAYGPNGRLWSDAQIRQAQDLALNAVRTVPGASYAGTLDMAARTSGITADAGEALALLPTMARAGQIFAMRGAGPSAIQQIEAVIQSSEISGLNGPNGQLDISKMKTFIERLSQTAFAMQGTFDLQKYLTGLRQYGVGASGSDMNFLTARLPSIMRVMQESRAGTALASLDQLMLSPAPNTRNARYAVEQRRIGLRDAHGDVVNRDELVRDPAQWYADTLVPALSSHGYTDRGAIISELSNIFSRSTVQRLAASLSADTALYTREYQKNLGQQAQGNAPLMSFLQNAPGAQFSAFTESWRAFEAVTSTAMMTPVVKAVGMITSSLTDVTAYVKAHPDDVRQFGDDVRILTGIMTGLAKGIGTVFSYIPAPLRHLLEGGIAGAAGGAVAGSVLPGAGTAAGAVVGGLLGSAGGAISDYRSSERDFENHVHVYLDGREIAQHVNAQNARQATQARRAQSSGADGLSTPQLPGAAWAH
ncbi:hypothetical protein AD929_15635 [Gluconobacter potus]|uniref:Uncharacterized protein n=1 Tax=Gluconobacter potus TaxID=2724927 RepID=A0A149QPL1_9PROT|nr:hypothetical protein [Gluconobacter potus]KXU99229.1 hypothetical protein AD929_15635 [Gluconobacter potus]